MDSSISHLQRVRVRLCYSGHEESVVGSVVDFQNHFTGFDATQGLVIRDWNYEYGDARTHHTDLFIKWESVFVIEEIEVVNGKFNKMINMLKAGGNDRE